MKPHIKEAAVMGNSRWKWMCRGSGEIGFGGSVTIAYLNWRRLLDGKISLEQMLKE